MYIYVRLFIFFPNCALTPLNILFMDQLKHQFVSMEKFFPFLFLIIFNYHLNENPQIDGWDSMCMRKGSKRWGSIIYGKTAEQEEDETETVAMQELPPTWVSSRNIPLVMQTVPCQSFFIGKMTIFNTIRGYYNHILY